MTRGEQPQAEPSDPRAIGVPDDAVERLRELTDSDGQPGLFTSDLSVNEFMLVKEAGFHPRGLVFGSSIFHIGLQVRNWATSSELTKLSEAMYLARQLAMERMVTEADLLSADGIVGVRLDIKYHDWGRHSAEFIAIGTAVSAVDGTNWRTDAGEPFTSDLSGQDFWTLVRTGYAPLGLVLGNCVFHIAHRVAGASLSTNQELPHFTQATYSARELAMTRMQAEATALGAEGIVGVQLVEKSHQWGNHVIEFLAVGTAVRPLAADHAIAQPTMTLSLEG